MESFALTQLEKLTGAHGNTEAPQLSPMARALAMIENPIKLLGPVDAAALGLFAFGVNSNAQTHYKAEAARAVAICLARAITSSRF